MDKETAKHCVIAIVGGDCTGHYRLNRGFYGLADMPVVLQDKLDRVLEGTAPAWQDDMIVVTRGTMSEHFEQVSDVLQKLDRTGYKASLRKSKFFEKQVDWCGFSISEKGIMPKNSRVEAIQSINPPTTLKEVRSFLGSVQYLMRYIPNLTEKTEPLRQLLTKKTKWIWSDIENAAFEGLKKDIQTIVPLKHYDVGEEPILTTDASTKGLGATLWQKEQTEERKNREQKLVRRPIAFASRFLNESEKTMLEMSWSF